MSHDFVRQQGRRKHTTQNASEDEEEGAEVREVREVGAAASGKSADSGKSGTGTDSEQACGKRVCVWQACVRAHHTTPHQHLLTSCCVLCCTKGDRSIRERTPMNLESVIRATLREAAIPLESLYTRSDSSSVASSSKWSTTMATPFQQVVLLDCERSSHDAGWVKDG